jgi:metallo-beta-lactamase family protein
MTSGNLKIKFYGAAGTVTGSKLVFEYQNKKYLFDCGLFQGSRDLRVKNWKPFEESKYIEAVILSHAHIDHSGYLPKLVKEGFKGPIYCTPATAELCEFLLLDAAHLQEEDARYANESGYSNHSPALPLYDREDAEKVLKQIQTVPFHQDFELSKDLKFNFSRAGHILGSAITQVSFLTNGVFKSLTMSGDVGNGRSCIIENPEALKQSDYLVLESTYGDRQQSRENPLDQLAVIINRVIERGGTLVIPAFAVGRTQELLYLIHKLQSENKIAKIKVFLDSPMANKATDVYLKYPQELKQELSGDELKSRLSSSHFIEVRSTEESMKLCLNQDPKIVISAGGMITGGRILHHLKSHLPDKKSGVLFVGYQASGTKGLLLKNGMRDIRIHHQKIKVEAEIFSIDSLSAHADSEDLLSFTNQIVPKPIKIFLNHGEPNALEALKYSLSVDQQQNVVIVKEGEEYLLE